MLDQVFVPRPLAARGVEQFAHHVPLVIARKDQAFLLVLAAFPVLLVFDLQVHEAGQDVEQVVRQQHLVPQVIGGVAVRVGGHVVAGPAVRRALVEGQENRVLALQPGRHVHLVLAHRKVHQRAAFEAQQRLRLFRHRVDGQAGRLVLAYGPLHRLLELGLQLQRRHRQAIHKQHQVDAPGFGLGSCAVLTLGLTRLACPRAIDQLRHHAQAVPGVAGQGVRVQIVFGLELAQRQPRIAVAQLVAQHAQGAKAAAVGVGGVGVGPGQLAGDQFEKLLRAVLRVVGAETLPLGRLRLLHKGQRVLRVERQLAVVAVGSTEQPAIGLQLPEDVVLEDALAGWVAHGWVRAGGGKEDQAAAGCQSRTSILPVTAAEIRAVRRSCMSSIAEIALWTKRSNSRFRLLT